MRKLSALIVTFCLMGFVMLVSSATAFGQGGTQPANDKKPDPEVERKAYAAYQACSTEKDLNKKIQLASEAITLYPGSTYVPYLKDQIVQAKGGLLEQAIQKNEPSTAFKVGEELLNENPENLDLLIFLSRYSVQVAKANKDYSFADKGTDYSRKAIAILNGDKVKYNEAKWNNLSKPSMMANLHQSIGVFLLNAKKDEEALNEFNESVKLNCADPVNYIYIAQIHKNRYEALSNTYRPMTDEQKSGDEGKALLGKIEGVVDQIVEYNARFLAVSEGKPAYDSVRNNAIKPEIETYYKFRHEGKLDGMQEMIDGFKASCAQK